MGWLPQGDKVVSTNERCCHTGEIGVGTVVLWSVIEAGGIQSPIPIPWGMVIRMGEGSWVSQTLGKVAVVSKAVGGEAVGRAAVVSGVAWEGGCW
jgi:hypothetical protein